MKTERKSRNPHGRFRSDEEMREDEEREQRPGEASLRQRRRNRDKLVKTERLFLRTLVEGITLEDIRAIRQGLIKRAREGDRDALAWLGKYAFGNGRISLDDVARPPMIRKSR